MTEARDYVNLKINPNLKKNHGLEIRLSALRPNGCQRLRGVDFSPQGSV